MFGLFDFVKGVGEKLVNKDEDAAQKYVGQKIRIPLD